MKVIILFGAPGSGKGTQAEKLSEFTGLAHLETSKIIEEGFAKADPNDKKILEEKKRKARGELTSPKMFAGWFNKKVDEVKAISKGIVTSGSMRTVEETEIILPKLEALYGRDNIKMVLINISEEESVKRNTHRRVCKLNKHNIPSADYNPDFANITHCKYDGSPFIYREDDKPEIIRKRYGVYTKETMPVFGYLKDRGYNIIKVNGEQRISKVFENICKHLT
ncbi:MAG: nucleoside monophosphate kinase [Candidatus Colwellbacteria bacterium]|nr:nucleoside monophosphate kinase [Candidatus Colwellbacteria bacterium]